MDRAVVLQLMQSFETGRITRREFLARMTIAAGSLATANLLLAACASATNKLPDVAPGEGTGVPPTAGAPEEATAEPSPAGGLLTEDVEYQDEAGDILMGYLARPQGTDPLPAVVVIQEWWGLNEHIKDVTRRFADAGYVALAPDLYHGEVVTEPSDAQKLAMALDTEAAVGEIRRAVTYLEGREDVHGPVAIVGFCMGGGLALQTAVGDDDLAAVVAFYGTPLSDEQAAQVTAPVLGLYGGQDAGNPVDKVNAMRDALTAAGVENDFHVYDDAGHAFFNDTRASYNEAAATDGWQRTLAWLQQHQG